MANEGRLNLAVTVVVAVIVVGALAGIYLFTSSGNRSQATSQSTTISQTSTIYANQTTTVSQNSSYQQSPNLPSCGSNYTLFTTRFFDPNSIISVVPIGSLVPPDHTFPSPHSYIYMVNPQTNQSKAGAPFYSPANMIIEQLAVRHATSPSGVSQTDYTLVLQPCKEFYLYFHLIPSLLYPPLRNATEQLAKQCGQNQSYCQVAVNIKITAGEAIGTMGNQTTQIFSLDIGARDYRLPTGRSAFVDPNRLCPLSNGQPNVFDRCYDVCPYSYLPQNVQQQIHFASSDGSVAAPGCGSVYQDVNGTAKGYWFPANGSASSFSPEATDLFLGQSNIQPQYGAFSVGLSVPQFSTGVYEFMPQASGYVNRDFGNVTPGSTYCYQVNGASGTNGVITSGPSTVIYLQLINKTMLLLQKQNTASCGNGPWSMGSNPAKFTR